MILEVCDWQLSSSGIHSAQLWLSALALNATLWLLMIYRGQYSSGYERGIRIYDMTETWVFSLNEHTPYFSSRFIFLWIVPCEVIKVITVYISPHCVIPKWENFHLKDVFIKDWCHWVFFKWQIDETCRLSRPITHLCQGREDNYSKKTWQTTIK